MDPQTENLQRTLKGLLLSFLVLCCFLAVIAVAAYNSKQNTEAGQPIPLSVSPVQDQGLPPIGPSVETDGWQIAPKGYIEYCKLNPLDCK